MRFFKIFTFLKKLRFSFIEQIYTRLYVPLLSLFSFCRSNWKGRNSFHNHPTYLLNLVFLFFLHWKFILLLPYCFQVIHSFDAEAEGELSLSVDDYVVVRQVSLVTPPTLSTKLLIEDYMLLFSFMFGF